MSQLPLTTIPTSGTMASSPDCRIGRIDSIYNVSMNSVPYTIGPITASTVMQSPTAVDWSKSICTGTNGTGVIESDDIKLNGKSLVKTLKALEERLAWLEPNSTIEKEWNELKELGNQYRTLEAEIKEKISVWEKLKT